MKKSGKWHRRSGLSMYAIVVAVGVSSILSMVLARVISNALSGMRSVELRGDLQSIKQLILTQLDCAATFANQTGGSVDPQDATLCNSDLTQSNTTTYLRLSRRTANDSTQFLMPPLESDGSAFVGNWSIRATCSANSQTLIIRAARKNLDGGFAKDPLTGKLLDWNSPRGLIFGVGLQAMPICYDRPIPIPIPSPALPIPLPSPAFPSNWPQHILCDGVGPHIIMFQFHAYLKDETIIRYRDLYNRDMDFWSYNGSFKRCDSCGLCQYVSIENQLKKW